MYKENGLNYIETQMELDLLKELPYRSDPTVTDPEDPDYEGEYPIAVTSELKPEKKYTCWMKEFRAAESS